MPALVLPTFSQHATLQDTKFEDLHWIDYIGKGHENSARRWRELCVFLLQLATRSQNIFLTCYSIPIHYLERSRIMISPFHLTNMPDSLSFEGNSGGHEYRSLLLLAHICVSSPACLSIGKQFSGGKLFGKKSVRTRKKPISCHLHLNNGIC